jgi:ATP-binding cassette subfamily F protein 3
MLAVSDAQLLILDEPTSQLDIYAQTALEKAIAGYQGTVLMVSHDFYLVSGCADYVLFVENNTIRRMGAKKFRRLVYGSYFEQSYLAVDRRKQELEKDINQAFKKNDLAAAEKLCAELAALSLPTQEAGE